MQGAVQGPAGAGAPAGGALRAVARRLRQLLVLAESLFRSNCLLSQVTAFVIMINMSVCLSVCLSACLLRLCFFLYFFASPAPCAWSHPKQQQQRAMPHAGSARPPGVSSSFLEKEWNNNKKKSTAAASLSFLFSRLSLLEPKSLGARQSPRSAYGFVVYGPLRTANMYICTYVHINMWPRATTRWN